MRQMYIKKETEVFFNLFSNKINRASKKIQDSFTYDKIHCMFISLELALKNQSQNGYYKYNLFELFCNPCFLLYCYLQLKITKSNNINNENITLSIILALSIKLVSKTYKPVPIRRVFISKGNGKMRPLSIASIIDTIVQKAILIFLDPIFEKQFLKYSYGFRKNKSCHTCLSQIYYNWTGIKWFIEVDFQNSFDQVNHAILMSLINKNFFNYQISWIISLVLKIGYINFGSILVNSKLDCKTGTHSGSLLSPFFCNIFLHSLDSFIISYCNKISHVCYKTDLKRWKIDDQSFRPKISKTLSNIQLQDTFFKKVYNCVENFIWRKLTYVRYADNFLLGFIGPKKEATKILTIISWFVELFLGMSLDIDKTNVQHHEKGVYFLGYKIWKKYCSNFKNENSNLRYNLLNKSTRLNFSIPLEKLFYHYAKLGFLQKAKKHSINKFVGRRQDKWLFLISDAAIIYRFNSIFKNIANYYSGSTQQGVLSRLYFALKKSAYLTIAHRNSKRNASWTKKKYGENLIIPTIKKNGRKEFVELFKPKAGKVKWHISSKGQLDSIFNIPIGVPIPQSLNVICSVKDLFCAIPNCPNSAKEWYYIKHRKQVKSKKLLKKSNINIAKQIPVCEKHYLLITNGKYNGPSLRKLKGYIPNNFD